MIFGLARKSINKTQTPRLFATLKTTRFLPGKNEEVLLNEIPQLSSVEKRTKDLAKMQLKSSTSLQVLQYLAVSTRVPMGKYCSLGLSKLNFRLLKKLFRFVENLFSA